jgi:polyisoprenyl-phosphate glycosyltransferase
MNISVVLPAYKCNDCINELYKRLLKTFEEMAVAQYEIIFINDGSPDYDWESINKLCKKDKKVKGINLARNYGQHKAITAGLDFANGEWIVVMDCDLQDRPEELPKLFDKLNSQRLVVFARRNNRKDFFVKKFFSKCFNSIFSYLLDHNLDNRVSNFSIMHKTVVNEVNKMKEISRTHYLLVLWLGYEIAYVDVDHGSRYSGKSSYDFKRSSRLAWNLALSYSNKPLLLFVKIGVYISIASFTFGLFLFIRYLSSGIDVLGWTSIMVSLYFIGGLLLACLGVLGLYIGKVFDEVKGRPLYTIRDLINMEGQELR